MGGVNADYSSLYQITCLYRDGLKSGPVLLSNNQARPGINFSQPRAHNKVHLCIIEDAVHCIFVDETFLNVSRVNYHITLT